jgi:hypothetical protein
MCTQYQRKQNYFMTVQFQRRNINTVQVKLFRCAPWWRLGGEEVWLLLILNLGTRWGWVVSITPRPRLIPGEGTTGTHCTGGWVGPQTQRPEEKSFASVGDRTPVVKSVVRHYTDWAVPAPYKYCTVFFCSLCRLLVKRAEFLLRSRSR